MKTLRATIIALVMVAVANPASAYVVAIATSIPAKNVGDDTALEAALRSAIDDVLRHAIAFSPTFVTVVKAWVVEERIYILLLIGDREGEDMMRKLSVEGTTDIKLPNQEEAISPVTILDGQGRVVRVVPAEEFRRRAETAGVRPARTQKYYRPAGAVARVTAR